MFRRYSNHRHCAYTYVYKLNTLSAQPFLPVFSLSLSVSVYMYVCVEKICMYVCMHVCIDISSFVCAFFSSLYELFRLRIYTLRSQRSPPPRWAKPLGLVGMIRPARAPAAIIRSEFGGILLGRSLGFRVSAGALAQGRHGLKRFRAFEGQGLWGLGLEVQGLQYTSRLSCAAFNVKHRETLPARGILNPSKLDSRMQYRRDSVLSHLFLRMAVELQR